MVTATTTRQGARTVPGPRRAPGDAPRVSAPEQPVFRTEAMATPVYPGRTARTWDDDDAEATRGLEANAHMRWLMNHGETRDDGRYALLSEPVPTISSGQRPAPTPGGNP